MKGVVSCKHPRPNDHLFALHSWAAQPKQQPCRDGLAKLVLLSAVADTQVRIAVVEQGTGHVIEAKQEPLLHIDYTPPKVSPMYRLFCFCQSKTSLCLCIMYRWFHEDSCCLASCLSTWLVLHSNVCAACFSLFCTSAGECCESFRWFATQPWR